MTTCTRIIIALVLVRQVVTIGSFSWPSRHGVSLAKKERKNYLAALELYLGWTLLTSCFITLKKPPLAGTVTQRKALSLLSRHRPSFKKEIRETERGSLFSAGV